MGMMQWPRIPRTLWLPKVNHPSEFIFKLGAPKVVLTPEGVLSRKGFESNQNWRAPSCNEVLLYSEVQQAAPSLTVF